MAQIPDLNFKDTAEFSEYLIKLHGDNPKKSIPELMDILLENGATVAGQDIGLIEDKNPGRGKTVLDYVQNKSTEEVPEISKNDLSPEPDKFREDMPFLEAAKSSNWGEIDNRTKIQSVVNDYEGILNDIKDLVSKKNSGEGLNGTALENFKKELAAKKQQLKDIEDSEEFAQLMRDVYSRGTGKLLSDASLLSPRTNRILDWIADGYGSTLFSDTDRLKNAIDGITNTTFDNLGYATTNLTDPRRIAAKYLQNQKQKMQEGSIEENPADKMKFGQDVDSQGYVNERNKQLGLILANRGLTTEDEINNFLNQYDSWKNAKESDKKITLRNLSGMAQSNYNKYMKQREKLEKEKADEERRAQGIGNRIDLSPSNDSPLNGEEEPTIKKLTKKINEDYTKKKADLDERQGENDGSDEANKSMDTYNQYMQLKAEGGSQDDMKKFFSNNVGVLGKNSEKKVKDNMKKAGLSNNQINDFVSDRKDTFKNDGTKKLEENKNIKTEKVLKNSPTITGLLKAKKK